MIKHKIEFVLVSDDETQDKITQKEGFEISDEAKKHVIEQMKGELQKTVISEFTRYWRKQKVEWVEGLKIERVEE